MWLFVGVGEWVRMWVYEQRILKKGSNCTVLVSFFIKMYEFRQCACSAFIPPVIFSVVFLKILSLAVPSILVWATVLVAFFLDFLPTSAHTFLFYQSNY